MGVRETVNEIIEHHVLPRIERDGISNLILPEQIAPEHCTNEVKCTREDPGHRQPEFAIGLTGEVPYCIDGKTFVFIPGRIAFLPSETPHEMIQTTWWGVPDLDLNQPQLILWLMVFPFGIRMEISRTIARDNAVEITPHFVLLDRHFSRLTRDLLDEVRSGRPRYAEVGRCLLMEFMQRCLQANASTVNINTLLVSYHHGGGPLNLADSGLRAPGRKPARRRRAKGRSTSLTTGRSTKTGTKKSVTRRKGPEKENLQQTAISARIQAAQEYIHSSYHHTFITMDDIAESAHLSVDYFGRLFKEEVGVTPIQYLLDIRMEAAKVLLLTDLNISEVARAIGINDPYYFSRVFRSANSASPTQYRKKTVEAARRSNRPPEKLTE